MSAHQELHLNITGTQTLQSTKTTSEGLFKYRLDFAGGSVASSIPGQGIRSHMLQLRDRTTQLKDPEGHS